MINFDGLVASLHIFAITYLKSFIPLKRNLTKAHKIVFLVFNEYLKSS